MIVPINARMNDVTAALGLEQLAQSDELLAIRRQSAFLYAQAIAGCSWIKPQSIPSGYSSDYWTYAIALESAQLWKPFTEAIVRHGGEMPYGAWRLTYQEPAFRHLAPDVTCGKCGDSCPGTKRDSNYNCPPSASPCPIAENLQPRLVQFQCNRLDSAEKNARAVKKAIAEMGALVAKIKANRTKAA